MKPALVLLAAMALLTVACSSSSGSGGETITPGETAEAGGLPPALQMVMDRISEIRGLEPVPDLDAEIVSRDDLPALVHMKLQSFRRVDQVHIEDLLTNGLIDETVIRGLPDDLRKRLREVQDTLGE